MEINNNKILVSVIVPVYNVERFLDKCITSILEQTHENLELILVDDGSVDNSLAICEKYIGDERVTVASIANSGPSAARNKGLDMAKGEYIVFSDSDDYFDEDLVENLLGHAIRGDYDMVACGMRYIYANSSVDYIISEAEVNREELVAKYFTENNIISSPCAKIYKRSLIGDLRYPIDKLYEDRYFSMEIFDRVKSAYFTGEAKYNYVQRKGSIVHSSFNRKKLFYIDIARRDIELVKEKYPKLERLVVDTVKDSIVETAKAILISGYYKNKYMYNYVVYSLALECENETRNKYTKYFKRKFLTRLTLQLRYLGGKILRKLGIRKSANEPI